MVVRLFFYVLAVKSGDSSRVAIRVWFVRVMISSWGSLVECISCSVFLPRYSETVDIKVVLSHEVIDNYAFVD